MAGKIVVSVKNIHIYKYFLLAFIFLPPGIVSVMPGLESFSLLLAIARLSISLLVIFIAFLTMFKNLVDRKKGDKTFIMPIGLFIAYGLWILLSDQINHTDLDTVGSTIRPLATTLGYLFIISMSCKKENLMNYIRGTCAYCVTLCLLNFMGQIIYPYGIYKTIKNWQPYHLCGNGNIFVFYYLFVIFITGIYGISKKKFPKWIIPFYVALCISVYTTESDTGFAVLVIMLLLMLFAFKFEIIFSFFRRRYKLIVLAAGIFAVWFLAFEGWNSDFMNEFVTDLFGRSTYGYSVRGSIWKAASEQIISSPFFGHGNAREMSTVFIRDKNLSAHNNYMQIAIIGGFPALLLLLTTILYPFRWLRRLREKRYILGVIILSGYIVAFMFEQRPYDIGVYAAALLTSVTAYYFSNAGGQEFASP